MKLEIVKRVLKACEGRFSELVSEYNLVTNLLEIFDGQDVECATPSEAEAFIKQYEELNNREQQLYDMMYYLGPEISDLQEYLIAWS